MCGIVGFIQSQKFSVKNKLLKSLKRLEYRGYDSVGFATKEGIVKKQTGSISAFIDVFDKDFETTAAHVFTLYTPNILRLLMPYAIFIQIILSFAGITFSLLFQYLTHANF